MTYLERKHSDAIADNTLNISSYFDPRFMIDYIDKDDVDDLRDRVLSISFIIFFFSPLFFFSILFVSSFFNSLFFHFWSDP